MQKALALLQDSCGSVMAMRRVPELSWRDEPAVGAVGIDKTSIFMAALRQPIVDIWKFIGKFRAQTLNLLGN